MLKSYDDCRQVDGSSEGEEVLADSQRLNYPTPSTTAPPINFVLTEFHVLLLYPNRVIGVSVLNQSMVFEDFYSEVSHLISGGTVVAPLYNAEHPFIQAWIIQGDSDTLYRRERVAPCVPVSLSISRNTTTHAHLILQFFHITIKEYLKVHN